MSFARMPLARADPCRHVRVSGRCEGAFGKCCRFFEDEPVAASVTTATHAR